ncbi:hypothetical protein IJ913_00160 [bacterium]|nr:hypothetical protein [bacterium]MBO7504840.1 hypothetical protein [bacterium]MBQ7616573.1 hypothetical protein [bacterium]MBR2157866.1 hypothetical protein [bacterium]MBR4567094.1 hypothetical protein [bacterium]
MARRLLRFASEDI